MENTQPVQPNDSFRFCCLGVLDGSTASDPMGLHHHLDEEYQEIMKTKA